MSLNYHFESGRITLDLGDDRRVIVPSRREVCGGCDGRGYHTNRGIDGNGLSDEYLADPDFMENYLDGAYDVTCEDCDGLRVALIVDEDGLDDLDPDVRDMIREELDGDRELAAEDAARAAGYIF